MGYTLEILKHSGNPAPALYEAVRQLVEEVEYLNKSWEGNLEFETLKECCQRTAASIGFEPNGGNPASWPGRDFRLEGAKGVLIEQKDASGTILAFLPASCFKDPRAKPLQIDSEQRTGGIAVKVVVSHDPTAKQMVCSCCGKKVSTKDTSLAHNVISQQAWKKILDAAMDRFLTVVSDGTLSGKVSSFETLSKLKSGSKDKMGDFAVHSFHEQTQVGQDAKAKKKLEFGDKPNKDQLKTIDKAGEDAVRKMSPKSDPANQELFDLLFAARMIEDSHYAASNQSGRQCRDCEEAQGDATLIQRDELQKDGHLPAIQQAKDFRDPNVFVGPQFSGLPKSIKIKGNEYKVLTKKDEDELVKRATLRQISRFLLGIEKVVSDYAMNMSKKETETALKQYAGDLSKAPEKKFPPLLTLLLDHWKEFVWTFRSVALEIASVKYTGNFGKLKFQDGKPV